jgi:exopolysaccharide biosynthesis polyprenyl glycosylphosphotransferase
MAGANRLLRASGRDAVDEPAFAGLTRRTVGKRYPDSYVAEASRGPSEAIDLLDNAPTLRLDHLGLAGDDQRQTDADSAVTVPARKRFAVWSLHYLMVLAAADALLGGVAVAVPASMSPTLSAYQAVPLLCLVGLLVWPTAIGLSQGYRRSRIGIGFDELRAVLRAGMTMVVACALPAGLLAVPTEALTHPTFSLPSPLYAPLKLVAVGMPIAVALSLMARFFARKVLHSLQKHGRSVRHVVVAGGAAAAQQLADRIQHEPHGGMKVIGLCLPSDELPRPVVDGIPVLGNLNQVADVARALCCDAVAVTSDDATRYDYLRKLAWSLEGAEVELLVDPGLDEVAGPRLHIRPLMGFPLVHVEEPQFTGWRRVVKRVSDVIFTSVGLVVIAPVMVGVAALIKLQDRGPVFFRQTRVGRGGELFTMFKFRSMVVDAEARKMDLIALNDGHGALFKLRDDPRITRIGKILRDFSLDELPQLFNVLRGSMSLVGPRPHLAHEVAQMPYEANRRSLVTPGLTGLWQVSGRSDLEEQDGIKLDLRYVENWSLTLDLLILWKTASAVLARRGAR